MTQDFYTGCLTSSLWGIGKALDALSSAMNVNMSDGDWETAIKRVREARIYLSSANDALSMAESNLNDSISRSVSCGG